MAKLLSLGVPPMHDVEAAAKLYLEYDAAGLLTPENAQCFAMKVADYRAVYARALELKQNPPAAGA